MTQEQEAQAEAAREELWWAHMATCVRGALGDLMTSDSESVRNHAAQSVLEAFGQAHQRARAEANRFDWIEREMASVFPDGYGGWCVRTPRLHQPGDLPCGGFRLREAVDSGMDRTPAPTPGARDAGE